MSEPDASSGPDGVGPDGDANDEDQAPNHESLLDELREMPVGTNDPNIIGDAGPLDIPPGSDPPEGLDDVEE